MYGYIKVSKKCWDVQELCRVLRVSESGYYRSLKVSDKYRRREHLLVRIKEIIGQYPDNNNYGARRVHLALLQEGETISYSTVYRVMKEKGLLKKAKRYPNGITREDAAAQKSENLINRDFTADAPNRKWLSGHYRSLVQRWQAVCGGSNGLLRR